MPRSWHSFTSYLCFNPTGSPQLSQVMTMFLLKVWQLLQITSSDESGLTRITEPHCLQFERRWWSPCNGPHLHCQLPMRYSTNSSDDVSRKSEIGKVERKTACNPVLSRSAGSRSICRNRS